MGAPPPTMTPPTSTGTVLWRACVFIGLFRITGVPDKYDTVNASKRGPQ
jgi:hypothetical protein